MRTATPATIVTGPSGAGKTYLLSMLYHRVAKIETGRSSTSIQPPPAVRIFVRRPAKSFLETYKDTIFPELKKIITETKPSIYNRWLFSIIERTGEHGVLTSGTLQELRKNPDLIESLDKRDLFRRDVLLQALDRDILERAPKEDVDDFLTVFRHLYDIPLQSLALRWLGGMPLEPAENEALQVGGQVDTNKRAINLILMMSNIFSCAGVPFFFFFDELDVLASQPVAQSDHEAFRGLLLGFIEDLPKYAFVILASLEEAFERLDLTVTTRLRHIRLTNLDARQASFLLDKYCRFGLNLSVDEILEPGASEILVEGSHGMPRQLLTLAHAGFEIAQKQRATRISAVMLAEAQTRVNQAGKLEVKRKVAEGLRKRGLIFAEDVTTELDGAGVQLDLAVPNGQAPILAFYFLSAAYLQSEARRSIDVLENLKRARQVWPSLNSEVLVVDGYLTRNVAARLLDDFEQIIYYDPAQFENDLERALRWFSERWERGLTRPPQPDRETEVISILRHELEQRKIREQDFYRELSDLKKAVREGMAPSNREPRLWFQRLAESLFGWKVSYNIARLLGIYVLLIVATLAVIPVYFQILPFYLLRQQTSTIAAMRQEVRNLGQRANDLSKELGPLGENVEGLAYELYAWQSCRLRETPPSISELLPPSNKVDAFLSEVEEWKAARMELVGAQKKINDFSVSLSDLESALQARNTELFRYRLSSVSLAQEDAEQGLKQAENMIQQARSVRPDVGTFYSSWVDSVDKYRSKLNRLCGLTPARK
jgi:hypothetical protein